MVFIYVIYRHCMTLNYADKCMLSLNKLLIAVLCFAIAGQCSNKNVIYRLDFGW